MKRLYLSFVFVAIMAGSLASMIAFQHLVANIAQPDVLPDRGPKSN